MTLDALIRHLTALRKAGYSGDSPILVADNDDVAWNAHFVSPLSREEVEEDYGIEMEGEGFSIVIHN